MSNYPEYTSVNQISQQEFFSRVIGYLGVGVGLNAVGAFFGSYLMPLVGNAYMFIMIILLLGQLALSFALGRNLESKPTSTVRTQFIIYSLIMGLTISWIFEVYTDGSILFAFVTSAVVFISLSVIGRTTKVDLSRFGSLLFFGLLSCIIVSLLNLFIFRTSMMELVMAYVETLLFMGLIAYDAQMIERYYSGTDNENYAIFAALQLELDFVNLFLRILSIFGKNKDD